MRAGRSILAALLLLAAAVWLLRPDPLRRSSRLLADAYSASRAFEWRLPDSGWSRPSAQRGPSARPASLFEAQAVLARHPAADSPWQILQARAHLLDLRPDPAIALLLQALAAAPNDPALLSDLAAAYALNADTAERPADFAAAVEFSTRALALHPTHPRALFNRALAFERLHMVDRAAADWDLLLQHEADPNWSAEAQSHLLRLRDSQHARTLALQSGAPTDALLESKAVLWLAQDRDRARQTAPLLLSAYDDRWLADAVDEPVDARPLLDAVQSILAGRAEAILPLTQTAVDFYSRRPAPAHLARARLEAANALNRALRTRECRDLTASVAHDAALRSWHWIHVQALLQHASCADMLGSLGASAGERLQAIQLAREHHIGGLEFRAIGLDASQRTAAGDLWASWRDNRDALARIQASPYSIFRVQQTLSNYSASAELWGWRAAAWQFMQAAADSIHGQNPILEAANRTRTAALALAAHLDRESAAEAQKAEALFASLPDSETRTRYLDSVHLLEGESYLLAGRPADAARILAPVAQAVVLPREQWRAHQLLGLGLLRTGDRFRAVDHLQSAAAILDARVASLPRAAERSQARREGLDAWRALAEALLDVDPSGAQSLRVWLSAHGSTQAPDLVFLAVANGYAVWTRHGALFHRIPRDRARVRRSVSRLLAAASDPIHAVSEIQAEARFLNDALLPAELNLAPAGGVLTVLPDAEIAAVPFSLLADAAGQWQAERFTTVLSSHARAAVPWTPVEQAVVVGAPATREHLPPLPESRLEAESVAARFPGATLLLGADATAPNLLRALPAAGLFHYSGHGYAGAAAGGLYLAGSLLTSAQLKAVELPRCRLAVLAACLTAVGQTGGLTNPDSLVHALLDAGVHTAVASRWAVDSAATLDFMSRFYSDLEATRDPAKSLSAAAAGLRADPRYRHPYYWAAFQTYE